MEISCAGQAYARPLYVGFWHGDKTRQLFDIVQPAANIAVRRQIHMAFRCVGDIGVRGDVGNGGLINRQPVLPGEVSVNGGQ